MYTSLEPSWKKILGSYFESQDWNDLSLFIEQEYKQKIIYPEKQDVFASFELCPFSKLKVVILGQDPYHQPDQAHGLSFSVPEGVKAPPSLKNILQELHTDISNPTLNSTDLTHWAKQGVLLLNSVLTVEHSAPGSHGRKGWEEFTNLVIKEISEHHEHIVFVLWGAYAKKKKGLIDETKHYIITAPHPSPLSSYRGFFGSKPFSKTNQYLKTHSITPIRW